MTRYMLSGVADDVVLRKLHALAAQDRATTAELLAHIAEVDQRKLYLPAAYPSMYRYCRGELKMSEDVAFKRIRVARAARAYPRILPAIECGDLSVSVVFLLDDHLTPTNADDLLSASTGKSKREVERLIAERFPKDDVPTQIIRIENPCAPTGPTGTFCLPVPGRVEEELSPVNQQSANGFALTAPAQFDDARVPPVPGQVEEAHPRLAPLSADRYELLTTITRHAHDQLRYAQDLLGHTVHPGDVAAVLERALDLLVSKLEQRKFAKSSRSRPKRGSKDPRHVPAEVRRQVWQRDGGQCTFVSAGGRRCEAHTRLEFDHIEPLARGGQTTTSNLRLRCRAHNQFEAEQAFGEGFIRTKRERARSLDAGRAKRRIELAGEAVAQRATPGPASTPELDGALEVIPWLRRLGFKPEEARRGAERCADCADAPLEQRLRVALRSLAPPARHMPAPSVNGAS